VVAAVPGVVLVLDLWRRRLVEDDKVTRNLELLSKHVMPRLAERHHVGASVTT